METVLRRDREFYTEDDILRELGITRERLHHLLDLHVFRHGEPRPGVIHFRAQDFVMIGEWLRRDAGPKVVRMPGHRRN